MTFSPALVREVMRENAPKLLAIATAVQTVTATLNLNNKDTADAQDHPRR